MNQQQRKKRVLNLSIQLLLLKTMLKPLLFLTVMLYKLNFKMKLTLKNLRSIKQLIALEEVMFQLPEILSVGQLPKENHQPWDQRDKSMVSRISWQKMVKMKWEISLQNKTSSDQKEFMNQFTNLFSQSLTTLTKLQNIKENTYHIKLDRWLNNKTESEPVLMSKLEDLLNQLFGDLLMLNLKNHKVLFNSLETQKKLMLLTQSHIKPDQTKTPLTEEFKSEELTSMLKKNEIFEIFKFENSVKNVFI